MADRRADGDRRARGVVAVQRCPRDHRSWAPHPRATHFFEQSAPASFSTPTSSRGRVVDAESTRECPCAHRMSDDAVRASRKRKLPKVTYHLLGEGLRAKFRSKWVRASSSREKPRASRPSVRPQPLVVPSSDVRRPRPSSNRSCASSSSSSCTSCLVSSSNSPSSPPWASCSSCGTSS